MKRRNLFTKAAVSFSIVVVLSVLFGLMLFSHDDIVLAQDDVSSCTGVDFLFLIDQSRSMQRNDLHQLRKSAVATAIDIIGDNAIYHCPGTVHRIAVVGFGGTSTGDIYNPNYEETYTTVYIQPSTEISGTAENLQAWKEFRDEKLKSSIPVTDDLVATDHLLAFRVASKIVNFWDENPIGSENRKKVVVMMTDGGPCINVVGNTCNWSQTEFGSLDGYLKKLESFTDPVGNNLPFRGDGNPESVYIWIVAFADSTIRGYDYMGNQALRSTWEGIAKYHGGKLEILQRNPDPKKANTELTKVIANITDDLLGSTLKPWNCNEPVWVNPYQNKVTIVHVFKRGADPGVDIKDVIVRIKVESSGQVISEFEAGRRVGGVVGETQDWTRDGPNERYVFYSPPPGKYTIEVKGADICQDIDVELGQVGIDAKVLSPSIDDIFSEVEEAPYYDIVNPRQFVFKFLQPGKKGEDVPVKEIDDYPLRATVVVTATSYTGDRKENFTYTLHLDETRPDDAIYKSLTKDGSPDYIRTPFAGDYQWHLKVQTRNPKSFEPGYENEPPITVLEKTGSFKVVPVNHFDFEIVEPRDEELILAYDVKDGEKVPVPIDVSIQLIDDQGKHLDPALVLADEDVDTFEITLLDAEGAPLETVKAKPKFGEPLLYATLRSSSTSPIDEPGEYRVSVRLLGNYKRDQYRPTTDTHEAFFKRTKPQAFTFAISSPSEGEIFPLVDGKLKQPLTVSVEIVDEDGNTLLASQFVDSEVSTPFEAILKDASGKTLDRKSLVLSKQDNVFSAGLVASQDDPLAFTEGNYLISVRLTDDYKFEIFRPQNQSAERQFYVQAVQPFVWVVSSPTSETTYPLHPTLRWFPDPQPIPLEISINDVTLPTGATSLLNDNNEALFTGKITTNQRDLVRTISYTPAITETKSGKFIADWPADVSCPGEYSLEVTLHEDNLSPAYILKDGSPKEYSITFFRKDSLLSRPWSLLMLLLLVPLALIEGGIIYLAKGPLAGAALEFFVANQSVGSVGISGKINRRKHTVKSGTLNQHLIDLNLDKITVKTSGNSADVELYWSAGYGDIEDMAGYETYDEDFIDDSYDEGPELVTLDLDEEYPSAPVGSNDATVEFVKGNSSWFTGWVAAAVLLPVIAWFAVLGYFLMQPPC